MNTNHSGADGNERIGFAEKRASIPVATYKIGYYDITPDDIEDTIKFAAGLGLDWANFSVATALPATDLHRIAQERGYVNGDF